MISDNLLKELNTPCFVVDKQALDENCNGFAAALTSQWGPSALSYSVKTNSLPWLLRYLHAKGILAEVVSGDEYDLARACGFEPCEIVYNGPVKGRAQLEECVLGGGFVNLDSNRDIDWIIELAQRTRRVLKVGLRVNFDIDAELPDDIGCAPYGTRFGFSVETGAFENALSRLRGCEYVCVAGLHMHSTSKTRAVAVYERLAQMAFELIQRHNLDLDYIDIGGGFFGGVPGKPTFEEYVGAIAKAFEGADIRMRTALIVEPGSAIIASPVSFVSSVVDVKDVARARVAVLDGGRPNIDPLHIKGRYGYRLIANSIERTDCQVIAGYTCMETDRIMVLEDELELAVGDRVVFEKVGSYTMSLNPLFISWFPEVYTIEGESVELVRGRWKASDIIKADEEALNRAHTAEPANVAEQTGCKHDDKVVWIFNHYAEEPGAGTGLRHYHLARHLKQMGWNPIVFAASTIHQSDVNLIEGDEPYLVKDVDGITFVYIKARNYVGNGKQRILNILDYTKGCRKVAPIFPAPTVIVASSVHPLAWHLGSRFSKRYGVPWICEVRDLWPESLIEFGLIGRKSLVAKAIRSYEKWAYEACDTLVFTMPGGIDYVQEQGWCGSVPESKVAWISNGIDLARFDREAKEFVYRDEDFEQEGYFRLLYCGSMGDSDALEGYLDAMKELQEKGIRDIRLFVFGDGPRRCDLERKCRDGGIEGVYFKGRVEKKYIPSLVSRSDANLLSVQWSRLLKYGCSFNKLFDYLAAGKPIVSNVSFGRSDFEEKECGVALKSKDDSLAKLIGDLRSLPEDDLVAMGQRSRALAADYDFSVLAKRYNDSLEMCNSSVSVE